MNCAYLTICWYNQPVVSNYYLIMQWYANEFIICLKCNDVSELLLKMSGLKTNNKTVAHHICCDTNL